MKTKTYDMYCDPGHGWLKVKRKELHDLGIQFKISSYSYVRNDDVFLEEDCDYSEFFQAMRDRGIIVRARYHHTNRDSKIRNYDRYLCQKA